MKALYIVSKLLQNPKQLTSYVVLFGGEEKFSESVCTSSKSDITRLRFSVFYGGMVVDSYEDKIDCSKLSGGKKIQGINSRAA